MAYARGGVRQYSERLRIPKVRLGMSRWAAGLVSVLLVAGCGSATRSGGIASESPSAGVQSPSAASSPASGSRQSPIPSPTSYPPLWVCRSPCPSERSTPGVAFDSGRQVLVLFGGYDKSGKVLNDTWEWSAASSWTEKHPSTIPPARGMTAIVYDRVRHVTLMYGGRDAVGGKVRCGEVGQWFCSDDTWTWDGTNWTELHATGGPPPFVPAMTFDDASGATLLYNFMGNVPGTWSWDGANWSLKASGSNNNPDPGRGEPVMVFDPASKHVVMFAGFSPGGGNVQTMWKWGGQSWTSFGVDAPFPRLGLDAVGNVDGKSLLAYTDPAVVPAAPPVTSTTPSQTWLWDGKQWTQLHPAHQPAVSGALFADPKSGRALLWGTDFMQGVAMQFWAWDGNDWSQIA